MAVWVGEVSGEIYFSWADAALANNDFEWAEYVVLPVVRTAAASPALLRAADGTLFVTYAIRFNEDRGIYLVQSQDDGTTWSAPVKVFDAALAGWDMVDLPRVVQTNDGILHFLWTRNLLPGYDHSVGLYSSRSDDGGATFSPPEVVFETPVAWSAIVAGSDQLVHRFWLAAHAGVMSLYHQISVDSGMTWGTPATLTALGETVSLVSIQSDAGGNLHLIQSIRSNDGKVRLKYMRWDGQRWLQEEGYELVNVEMGQILAVSAGLSVQDQELNVGYALAETDPESDQPVVSFYWIKRAISLPEVVASTPSTAQPTLEPTSDVSLETQPASTPEVAQTAEMQATLQPVPTQPGSQGGESPAGLPTWAGLAVGVVLALIAVVSLYFVARLIFSRAGKS